MLINQSHKRRAFLTLLFLMLLLCAACTQNSAADYRKALDLFGQNEYEKAAASFERLGEYLQAPTYAAYSQGMVFFEQGQYELAEPYFEKTPDFMYGKIRYTYCHAFTLEQLGSFARASELYASLGDHETLEGFENVKKAASYCRGRAMHQEQRFEDALYAFQEASDYGDATTYLEELETQIYAQATKYQEQGEYEKALDLFIMLGDYFNSPQLAREAKEFVRRDQYAQAEMLESQGKLQEAYESFRSLSGFGDAQVRAEDLALRLGIDIQNIE